MNTFVKGNSENCNIFFFIKYVQTSVLSEFPVYATILFLSYLFIVMHGDLGLTQLGLKQIPQIQEVLVELNKTEQNHITITSSNISSYSLSYTLWENWRSTHQINQKLKYYNQNHYLPKQISTGVFWVGEVGGGSTDDLSDEYIYSLGGSCMEIE